MSVIVGGVVEKDGKYLLVQESNAKCYGKWNLPAGHLDIGETLLEGAKREIKEETNCDVELTGICQIGNQLKDDEVWVSVGFATKLLSCDPKPQAGEILDLKWFTYEEILANRDQLRAPEWIIDMIENVRNHKVAPLDLINVVTNHVIN